MTRRIQVLVGLAATILNVVAIVYFALWTTQTALLQGQYGPASYLLTALWTALIGVIATVTWFLIGLCGKLTPRISPTEKPASPSLTLFQGIMLVVLLFPVCLAVWIGVKALPATRLHSQINHMTWWAATPDELIDGLKSPNWRVRSAAARALGVIKDRSAVESLIGCLRDPDGPRMSAAHALAEIADPRAMKPLVEALDDEIYMVRRWAVVGLGRLGDTSCIPALEEHAQVESRNRKSVERAIEAIRKRERSERLR
jgi:hypothetical protein